MNELKPLIPGRAIQISTNSKDIVLDPFGGGGSTYQEAQKLGRLWLGCEIGDCAPIERRFEEFAPLTLRRKPPQELLAFLAIRNPMPKIADHTYFNGTNEKLDRLGLRGLWDELQTLLSRF